MKGREPRRISYSVARLRSDLARALREAEAGGAVEITRRGEPVAVLLGRGDYERLRRGGEDFWERYARFRERTDLDALDLDPDEIFGGVRDRSPGREVDW
ncbi:MAG: type II toxin-antitoxin system prevent-host-death family antitoxin [Acidobacteriota bacterium]